MTETWEFDDDQIDLWRVGQSLSDYPPVADVVTRPEAHAGTCTTGCPTSCPCRCHSRLARNT